MKTGWKPLPLSLKILSIVLILWIIGSILAISSRFELGLPFFGVFISGIAAALVVFILDILAPIAFLYALCKRKSWGPTVAYIYMGIFVLNSIVALFTVRDQMGTMPVVIPALVTLIFLAVIYAERKYFYAK